MPPKARRAFLESLSDEELRFLLADWRVWARADQLPPPGDWSSWVLLGGRGAGKTRAGAEWVRALVEGKTPLAPGACGRVALVAETYADAREVMIEGPSGLRATAPGDRRPRYEAARRKLTWPNGAQAFVYSGQEPDSLRGPQFEAAWCDELAKWRYADAAWDMLQFALRLGARPRAVVTTTPRPVPALKRILAAPDTVVSRATSYANRANLAPAFFEAILKRYAGTRLGRQEIDAELLEDNPDALWRRAVI